MKTSFVQAKVEGRHRTRLEELQKLTGLNQSEVLRRLIENAEIASAPSPISRMQNGTGFARQDKVASAVL